jgi:hypothetical protein
LRARRGARKAARGAPRGGIRCSEGGARCSEGGSRCSCGVREVLLRGPRGAPATGARYSCGVREVLGRRREVLLGGARGARKAARGAPGRGARCSCGGCEVLGRRREVRTGSLGDTFSGRWRTRSGRIGSAGRGRGVATRGPGRLGPAGSAARTGGWGDSARADRGRVARARRWGRTETSSGFVGTRGVWRRRRRQRIEACFFSSSPRERGAGGVGRRGSPAARGSSWGPSGPFLSGVEQVAEDRRRCRVRERVRHRGLSSRLRVPSV